jgi:crotonobetainyl-CoA:carnitine CoA-transferase CaiB-like acyl-CoA transferase
LETFVLTSIANGVTLYIVVMLNNLIVIELASVLAGPSVGQFFAELGAEVVKIENINTGGDVTRCWKGKEENTDDRSAYFCSVNWGKKSVALDLNNVGDLNVVHKLVERADIVITSYKPGDAEKLKVDYLTLSTLNPNVIYGEVTGYGNANTRVGYDAIIQAESGFMYMNGELGGASLKMPVALIDVLAGHQLKEGILLALLERTTTGRGRKVEVSLIQSAIASLVNQASNWLVGGVIPVKQGSQHPNIAPYGDVFQTKDDHEILLAVGSDRQFRDLCFVLEASELPTQPPFNTNQERVKNRVQLHEILSHRFKHFSLSDVLERLHHVNVPAGVIQNIAQVFELPEASSLLLYTQNLKGVRTFVASNSEILPLLPPPHFGEHTLEVRRAVEAN